MNIVFIGGGNMASALIGGILKGGAAASTIKVVEVSPEARARLRATYSVDADADLNAATTADIVVLAIKPQQMAELAGALGSRLSRQLVISVAAGIRTEDLARWLGGHRRIVRVMPNTPALVLAGISGLYAMPEVSVAEKQQAANMLRSVGEIVWLPSEDDIDAVTAVSGSGPAYVFYFIEALQAAAQAQGLDEATARALTLHTFSGAAKLAMESTEPAAELRRRVTSKGGTTEKALEQMHLLEVHQAIGKAVAAAAQRSRELGGQLGAGTPSKT